MEKKATEKDIKDMLFANIKLKPDRSLELERKRRINIIALEGIIKDVNPKYKREIYPIGDERNTYTHVSYALKGGIQIYLESVWDLEWSDRKIGKEATCKKAEVYSKEFKKMGLPLSELAKELAEKYNVSYGKEEGREDDVGMFFTKKVTNLAFLREAIENISFAQEAYTKAEKKLMDLLRSYASET